VHGAAEPAEEAGLGDLGQLGARAGGGQPHGAFALERCDYVTIATTLGIPKGTVGSRIARARTLLRGLLLG
jgi:hypothetical protein